MDIDLQGGKITMRLTIQMFTPEYKAEPVHFVVASWAAGSGDIAQPGNRRGNLEELGGESTKNGEFKERPLENRARRVERLRRTR
jgi:hypothetical protein